MGRLAEPVRLNRGTHIELDAEASEADLFSYVGNPLACMSASTSPPALAWDVSNYSQNGRSWKVYSNFEKSVSARFSESVGDQLPLALPVSPRTVSLIIAPQCAVFMNATIRSFFCNSRLLDNASKHLMSQDLLYIGDLTQMSRREFMLRLGRYRKLTTIFEEQLSVLGLGFSGAAPWWRRPTDYYAGTY